MTNTLYATFHVDDAFFGVDATDVQEVIRTQPMTRVPLASDEVSGLINLRGQVVVAIDMRRRLGMPEPDEGAELLNVIVRTEHGPVSLIVDDIGDVLEADLDELETPPPTLTPPTRDLVSAVHQLDERLLLVIGVSRTIDAAA
ncbi:MAG: chemotaxis protein CheW [Acidimicrobiales bacterium]|nr:chemotaxis protein CheW [Acidimicrobiales bacterium]